MRTLGSIGTAERLAAGSGGGGAGVAGGGGGAALEADESDIAFCEVFGVQPNVRASTPRHRIRDLNI